MSQIDTALCYFIMLLTDLCRELHHFTKGLVVLASVLIHDFGSSSENVSVEADKTEPLF